MRRLDRAVTEKAELIEILNRCKVCRVAIYDQPFPYIVPLNYGYEVKDDIFYIYLHCAKVGKKIDLLRKHPHVCLEMDGAHQLTASGDQACDYSYYYESIIAAGIAEFIENNDEKRHGLSCLMKQQTGKVFTEFAQPGVDAVAVIRVTIQKISGKHHTAMPKK